MNQHWCPGTSVLTGAIYSHIFLFLKEVFFWGFVEIVMLRGKTGLAYFGPLQLWALISGVMGAPTASRAHPSQRAAVGLSLQSLTSPCPVLCARHWSCLQGRFDQFPASCWVSRGSSIISGLCMCHPGVQNHRCLPPLGWCSLPPSPNHKFVLFLFKIRLCGFWGNSVFVQRPSMGCVVWPVAHKNGAVALWRI